MGFGYLVFFSSLFKLDKIEYSPTKFINREDLVKAENNGETFLDNNTITFGLVGISKRFSGVTGVAKISVEHLSQHNIRIKIVEKSPLLIWETLNQKYLVDDSGYIWGNFEDTYASLPTLIDTKNLPVKIGDKVLPQASVDFFNYLSNNFNDQTGARASKYEIMDIVSDLKITTDAGWYVYFDTTRTAKGELISLKRVLSEAKTSGSSNLEYIDLRIANRIFYK